MKSLTILTLTIITFNLNIYSSYEPNSNQTIKTQNPDSIIYSTADSLPQFHNKEYKTTKEALINYYRQHYKMPAILCDNAYFGKVFINCIIEADGTLSNIQIKRGIDKPLDESILSFIEKMPPWIPAKVNDKPVRFNYTFFVDIKWMYGEV